MKRILIGSVVVFALFTTILMAGVVKTRFVTEGLFVTGSSKITGNDTRFTQCDYFDAETFEYIESIGVAGVGFDNEADLEAFCTENAPE